MNRNRRQFTLVKLDPQQHLRRLPLSVSLRYRRPLCLSLHFCQKPLAIACRRRRPILSCVREQVSLSTVPPLLDRLAQPQLLLLCRLMLQGLPNPKCLTITPRIPPHPPLLDQPAQSRLLQSLSNPKRTTTTPRIPLHPPFQHRPARLLHYLSLHQRRWHMGHSAHQWLWRGRKCTG